MAQMITKILIANRGEIACRVMHTARMMGIQTVAVYSDADKDAMHVQQADETVHIGPSSAAESYLVQDKIINACKTTGANAVHPGYGFLSENPDFADRCAREGIIFIGPSADSMKAMALKGTAKQLMVDAGVPVVPGYHGDDQDDAVLYKAAVDMGFPVLIKAVAGGGGKGMRSVHSESELKEAIISARSEGEKSFGNGKLLIEKLIQKPRHIELQVFGDTFGNAVHLMERDCSIQRRHQKVVEEAPAPGMSDAMREKMGDAAVNAAKAVNYAGAGTVEFIVDVGEGLEDAPFYFMEMNTRLQVEHPVSEMITGVDLVEWQIRIAQGEMLPMTQEDIVDGSMGHAIEVRLYAEDPANNYLPAIGRLDLFASTAETSDIRVETGVRSGDEISIHYDPMIAKLVVYGEDRKRAILKMRQALAETIIAGTRTNRDFLARIMADPDFVEANLDTGFLNGKYDSLCADPAWTERDYITAALLAYAHENANGQSESNDPWARRDGFRVNMPAYYEARFDKDGSAISVLLTMDSNDDQMITATCGDVSLPACAIRLSDSFAAVTLNGVSTQIRYALTDTSVTMAHADRSLTLPLYAPDYGAEAAASGDGIIIAPMPGKILDIRAANGDTVSAGDTIIVMEAMKMEQSLKAPRDGIIDLLSVAVGDQVSEKTVLCDVKAEKEE